MDNRKCILASAVEMLNASDILPLAVYFVEMSFIDCHLSSHEYPSICRHRCRFCWCRIYGDVTSRLTFMMMSNKRWRHCLLASILQSLRHYGDLWPFSVIVTRNTIRRPLSLKTMRRMRRRMLHTIPKTTKSFFPRRARAGKWKSS